MIAEVKIDCSNFDLQEVPKSLFVKCIMEDMFRNRSPQIYNGETSKSVLWTVDKKVIAGCLYETNSPNRYYVSSDFLRRKKKWRKRMIKSKTIKAEEKQISS